MSYFSLVINSIDKPNDCTSLVGGVIQTRSLYPYLIQERQHTSHHLTKKMCATQKQQSNVIGQIKNVKMNSNQTGKKSGHELSDNSWANKPRKTLQLTQTFKVNKIVPNVWVGVLISHFLPNLEVSIL